GDQGRWSEASCSVRSGAHCPSRHEDVTRRHRGDDGGRAMSHMVAWTYLSLGYPHRELTLGRPRPRVPCAERIPAKCLRSSKARKTPAKYDANETDSRTGSFDMMPKNRS